jgi:hypothetical protein
MAATLTGRVPNSSLLSYVGGMRNLLRQPLTWMVTAEFIVVATLMLLVWGLVASAAPHPATSQVQAAEPHDTGSTTPSPELPEVPRSTAQPQLPGLNLDAGFWRLRLGQLNREQVSFEQLEWHIVRSAMDAIQHYLETVVLPSIARAERAGGG